MRTTMMATAVLLGWLMIAVGSARAQTEAADAVEQTGCIAPFAAADPTGPVFRNTRLSITDTPAGTVFTLGGCVQNNGPAGSFASYLIKGLIFDRAGNLLVFSSAETNPVAAGNPAPELAMQTWAMSSSAGYPIAHSQIRSTVLLIVYSRGCPDGIPANCTKPSYDNGPTYILTIPCVSDEGAVVPSTAAACPSAAPQPPAPAPVPVPQPLASSPAPTPSPAAAAPPDIVAPASPVAAPQPESASLATPPPKRVRRRPTGATHRPPPS